MVWMPQAAPEANSSSGSTSPSQPMKWRLGLVVGRAVDGRPPRVELQVQVVATLERCETFLDRAPFRVPFAHPGRVLPGCQGR